MSKTTGSSQGGDAKNTKTRSPLEREVLASLKRVKEEKEDRSPRAKATRVNVPAFLQLAGYLGDEFPEGFGKHLKACRGKASHIFPVAGLEEVIARVEKKLG